MSNKCILCGSTYRVFYSPDFEDMACEECQNRFSKRKIVTPNIDIEYYYLSLSLESLMEKDLGYKKSYLNAKRKFLSFNWGTGDSAYAYSNGNLIFRAQMDDSCIIFVYSPVGFFIILEEEYKLIFNEDCPLKPYEPF